MAEIDRLEVEVEAQAAKANKQLDNLISKLEKVSTALTGVNASGLAGFANGISKIAGASAQLGNVKTADFTRLAKNLEKMAGVDQASLNRTSASLNAMSQSLGKIRGASQSALQISEIAKNIAKLGNKSVQNAMDNMPRLASGLNEMMNTLSKAPTVSNNLIQMTNALANLASQGSKVGAAMNSMGVKGSKGTSLLSGWLGKLTTSTGRAMKSTKSFSQAAGSFYANFYVLIRGLRKAWSATESSMDFLETVNYFEVAMRKLGDDAVANWEQAGYDSAEAYAKSFSDRAKQLTKKMTGYEVDEDGNATYAGVKNLGMNPDSVMNYQAMFAQVSESIGVAEESALNFSAALTMLGADWASLRNTTFEEAWGKFASALAGQSRAVRAFGIDITNATLQEYAYKYGLTTAIQEMNQATKAQLRLLAILDQSKVAFGDLANTMESPSNQLRMLKQNFSNLARTIGNLFLPIVSAVLPYINGLVMALQRLFSWIGGLLGIKFNSINSSIGGMDNGVEDLVGGVDDAEDSLNGANDAAKKLKNTILGFDEINQLNDDTDSSSGGSGSSGGIGGGSELLDEEIANALAKYQTEWDKAFDRMENKAQDIADRICNAFKRGDYKGIGRYISNEITNGLEAINWDSVYGVSKNFGKGFAEFLNGLITPGLFGAVGKTIAGALNTAIYAELSFGENFDFKNLGNSIAAGINGFFGTYDFKALAQTLNVWAKGILDAIITALDNTDWEMIGRQIGTFLAEIDFIEVGAKIGEAIWKAINAGVDIFAGIFNAAPVETTIITMLGFSKAWKAITGTEFSKALKSFKTFTNKAKLLTSAFAGNTGAMIDLTQQYPKLSKQVTTTTKHFTSFKNLFKGNFFGNLNTAITGIRNNMSGMTKGVITAVAGFAEFKIVSGTFKDLVNGSESLVAGIGKIAGATAVAGAAMYTALGPAGLVITAITGVVGAVKGISDAFEEIRAETIGDAIYKALSSPGGVSIDELTENTVAAIENIGSSFSYLSEKSNELDAADKNIEDIKQQIELVEAELEAGTITAEEAQEKFTTLLNELDTVVQSRFNSINSYVVAAFGEDGAWAQAFENAGVDVSEMVGETLGLTAELQDRFTELSQELAATDPTNPHYQELLVEIYELIGQTDSLEDAWNDFDNTISSMTIDYSGLVAKDGTLDTDEVELKMKSIRNAVNTANSDIDAAGAEMQTTLEQLLSGAKAEGNQEAIDYYNRMLSELSTVILNQKESVGLKAKELTDTIQAGLLDKIKQMAEDSYDEWDKMTSKERAPFVNASDYATQKINSYVKEVIEPFSETVESEIGELGVEGAGWSEEAGQRIIDGIFDYDYASNNVEPTKQGMLDVWNKIIDDVASDTTQWTETSFEKAGERGGEGYTSGLKKTSNISSAILPWKEEVDKYLGITSDSFNSLGKNIEDTVDLSTNNISGFKDSVESDFTSLNSSVEQNKTGWGLWKENILSITEKATSSISDFTRNINSDFSSAQTSANNLIGTLDNTTESAKDLYSQSGKTFSVNTDQNSFSTLRNAISGVFDVVNNLFSFNGRTLAINGGIGVGIAGTGSIGVRGYATGGFPNSGELFVARENGLNEMIGRVGNRSAVANNDQIVASIQGGVEAAMMNVMMAFAGNMGSGNSETPVIENVIKCDSETLYRATQKGKEKHDRRYHTVTEF